MMKLFRIRTRVLNTNVGKLSCLQMTSCVPRMFCEDVLPKHRGFHVPFLQNSTSPLSATDLLFIKRKPKSEKHEKRGFLYDNTFTTQELNRIYNFHPITQLDIKCVPLQLTKDIKVDKKLTPKLISVTMFHCKKYFF